MVAILAALSAGSAWVLTPYGLGPVRIGMTQAQVARVIGGRLEGQAIESDDICVEKSAPGHAGVTFMFEDRKLVRISISEESKIGTPRGLRVGADAAAVRRAYGARLRSEPHTYVEKPAEYLTFWTSPKKRGVRFETDAKRKVTVIHAGSGAIQYVEGCA